MQNIPDDLELMFVFVAGCWQGEPVPAAPRSDPLDPAGVPGPLWGHHRQQGGRL